MGEIPEGLHRLRIALCGTPALRADHACRRDDIAWPGPAAGLPDLRGRPRLGRLRPQDPPGYAACTPFRSLPGVVGGRTDPPCRLASRRDGRPTWRSFDTPPRSSGDPEPCKASCAPALSRRGPFRSIEISARVLLDRMAWRIARRGRHVRRLSARMLHTYRKSLDRLFDDPGGFTPDVRHWRRRNLSHALHGAPGDPRTCQRRRGHQAARRRTQIGRPSRLRHVRRSACALEQTPTTLGADGP